MGVLAIHKSCGTPSKLNRCVCFYETFFGCKSFIFGKRATL
jgi:hypothetical protein